ncbi:MAG: arylesterase [Acidobacteriota bacterium]|nr:arylesterase [Acidobacteriota bacterium]
MFRAHTSHKKTAAACGLVLAALASGCSWGAPAADTAAKPAVAAPAASATAPGQPASDRPRVVFLGDSITAGLGLASSQAFPSVIAEKLRAEGYQAEVVNAGISGDTAAGGRRRLGWALDGNVRVLVLALGANDGLRGSPVADMKGNLQAIIRQAKARSIPVLLLGMEALPNFGPEYTTQFRLAFRDLAEEEDVELVPFFLDGVAGVPSLNQPDGLHPNADGARRIADTVWKALEPIVSAQAPKR